MLAKLTSEMLAMVGATTVAEFPEKFAAFTKLAQENASAMAQNQTTLETLQASITALEGKLLTEARVKEIVGAESATAIATWSGSDAGKKIIGAESSRITMEALASVGTTPAKPAPVSADATNATAIQNLEAQGKFEEAWAVDKNIQAEFPSAKGYAAFRRAQFNGQVRIATK